MGRRLSVFFFTVEMGMIWLCDLQQTIDEIDENIKFHTYFTTYSNSLQLNMNISAPVEVAKVAGGYQKQLFMNTANPQGEYGYLGHQNIFPFNGKSFVPR